MLAFEIHGWIEVGDRVWVGTCLPQDIDSLGDLVGQLVRLTRKEKARAFEVIGTEPPIPDHLPPYRKGEEVALVIKKPDADALARALERSVA